MKTLVIRLSDSSRRALQEAAADAGGDPLIIAASRPFIQRAGFTPAVSLTDDSTVLETPVNGRSLVLKLREPRLCTNPS